MNTLSRHIERILLNHDCVVVPQFGGFVTMGTSSTREETEQVFFPPIRVVRFNPELTEDDGLLISDVREELRCQDSEAKRHIQRLVLHLRQQLLADGQVDFGCIGVFSQDEDGRVSFAPCQAGLPTPNYFGLDAFLMPKLTTAQRTGKHRIVQQQTNNESSSDSQGIIIHISRRSIKNVIAAAAIILLCVLFSSPFDDHHSNQASLLPSESVTEKPKPKAETPVKVASGPSKETAPVSPVTTAEPSAPSTSPAVASEASSETAVTEKSTPAPVDDIKSTPKGTHCIVLASNVSLKNANRYVQTLQERGFANARVYNNGKMNRVIIDGFQSETEAYNKNVELHHTNKEYASTWVMAL